MENLGKGIFFIIALISGAIVNGFVVMTLYNWFIIPVFNAPSFNIYESIGICILISYFMTPRKTDDSKSGTEIVIEYIVRTAFTAIITLGVGFIAQLFV